jgi:hypothetical protein
MATGKIRADTRIMNLCPQEKIHTHARAPHPSRAALRARARYPRACRIPAASRDARRVLGSLGHGEAGGWRRGAASGGAMPLSPRVEEAGHWRPHRRPRLELRCRCGGGQSWRRGSRLQASGSRPSRLRESGGVLRVEESHSPWLGRPEAQARCQPVRPGLRCGEGEVCVRA